MLYWGVKFPADRSIGLIQFPQDQIVFYRGLYGIPSYVIWYIASDKRTDWLKSGDIFEFFVFNAPGKKTGAGWKYPEPHIVDAMVITNIIFDVEIQMFKITAVSHFWYLLANTKQLPAIDVGTQDNPVSGIEVIKKLVEIANRDQFIGGAIDGSGALPEIESSVMSKIKYISINEDPEVSVLDKIADICLENAWEWYIGKGSIEGKRYNVLYIANKLRIKEGYVFPFEPEEGHRQAIQTSLHTIITTESVWCEPMLSYGKPARGRVLWVKFFLGNEGGLMTVMMQNISFNEITGLGTFKFFSENEFIETLDTGLAKEYGIKRLFKYPIRSYPILIGKMFGELTNENRDEYSASRWSGDASINTRNINKKIFKTEFTDKERRPQHYLKDRKITTPFAGDGVGLLFPQVEGHKTILAPDGERDSAIIGPGYFGPEDEVPARTLSKDFRLQLPNGWCLYISEAGDTILQVSGTDSKTPLEDIDINQGLHFLTNNAQGKKEFILNLDVSNFISFTSGTDGLLQMGAQGSISLLAENGNIIFLSPNGDVTIQANKASIEAPNIKIDGGAVDINGVTIMKGGIIKCTMLTTSGGVVPPNVV